MLCNKFVRARKGTRVAALAAAPTEKESLSPLILGMEDISRYSPQAVCPASAPEEGKSFLGDAPVRTVLATLSDMRSNNQMTSRGLSQSKKNNTSKSFQVTRTITDVQIPKLEKVPYEKNERKAIAAVIKSEQSIQLLNSENSENCEPNILQRNFGSGAKGPNPLREHLVEGTVIPVDTKLLSVKQEEEHVALLGPDGQECSNFRIPFTPNPTVQHIPKVPKRRKQTSRACTNCVKAKAGCDKNRPCGRCVRLQKSACIDRQLKEKDKKPDLVSSKKRNPSLSPPGGSHHKRKHAKAHPSEHASQPRKTNIPRKRARRATRITANISASHKVEPVKASPVPPPVLETPPSPPIVKISSPVISPLLLVPSPPLTPAFVVTDPALSPPIPPALAFNNHFVPPLPPPPSPPPLSPTINECIETCCSSIGPMSNGSPFGGPIVMPVEEMKVSDDSKDLADRFANFFMKTCKSVISSIGMDYHKLSGLVTFFIQHAENISDARSRLYTAQRAFKSPKSSDTFRVYEFKPTLKCVNESNEMLSHSLLTNWNFGEIKMCFTMESLHAVTSLIEVNDTVLHILGRTKADILVTLTKKIHSLVHENDWAAFLNRVIDVLTKQYVDVTDIFHFVRPDGSVVKCVAMLRSDTNSGDSTTVQLCLMPLSEF